MPAIGQEKLEFHRMYRVMRTVKEMMIDRGYQVAEDVVPDTLESFMQRYVVDAEVPDGVEKSGEAAPLRRQLVILRHKLLLHCQRQMSHDAVEKALVVFRAPDDLTSEHVKRMVMEAQNNEYSRLIFVAATKPNALVRRSITTVNREQEQIRIELFEEDELAVNITRHELVPKHRPLSDEELKAVLQAHTLELSQLPRILSSDPVARYFGLERGRVVCIERKSMSAGMYVTYRQVV